MCDVLPAGLPYVDQTQLLPYVDDGAYGWDIVDGFNIKVATTFQLCNRPDDIVVSSLP